jgi:protein-S-isoprenylcysteine O-methyltransferase Ste14
MPRRTAVQDPWVWGQVFLIAAIVLGVPWGAGHWGFHDPGGLTEIAGFTLIALGLGILYAGIAVLGRNLTPATEPLPEGELVTNGIYRVVRHPIYLGVSMALGGYGVWRGGWAGGLVAFGAALVYFERKARVEERWLMARMPGYAEYRARVPRILPGGWH